MAGKISELTSLPAADRTTNLVEVVSGSTSYKTTPNFLLGFSGGNPVSTSDTQTLTNKTLTAPTLSSPILSGTVTGTYTLAGTPTFPATVVSTTGVQTLTNKTLTSPTLTTPTLTNASISADAITGFTTSNSGTIYGIAITSGALSGAAITANTIPGTALNGTNRIFRQNNTTNTTETAARILTGWGFVTGTGTASASKAVTFTTAFTSPPVVVVNVIGYKNTTDPSSISDLGAGGVGGGAIFSFDSITTTGLNVTYNQSGALATTSRILFGWIAIGT